MPSSTHTGRQSGSKKCINSSKHQNKLAHLALFNGCAMRHCHIAVLGGEGSF
jgi:hypothetical protein